VQPLLSSSSAAVQPDPPAPPGLQTALIEPRQLTLMQALLPRLADLEPLVRVRLLLAALYLRPDEASAIRSELQVRDLVLCYSKAQAAHRYSLQCLSIRSCTARPLPTTAGGTI